MFCSFSSRAVSSDALFDIAAVFAAEEINPDFIRTECGLSHKAEFVAVCGNLF